MSWSVERHGRVAVLVFTRPPENLMTYVLLDELDALLVALADDDDVTVVVLTGGVAHYFVGHADLDDVEQLAEGRAGPGDPDAWDRALGRLASIPQPVVAAVDGQAWGGGCELALACLFRVASPAAHFRFVEVGAGAIPGAGGTQRLPRLIGVPAAAHMILSGRIVDASEAARLGLVDAVLAGDDFRTAAVAWARQIADQPRHTVVAAKRAIVDGRAMSLRDGLDHEQRIFRAVVASPESQGIFAEHREAEHREAEHREAERNAGHDGTGT